MGNRQKRAATNSMCTDYNESEQPFEKIGLPELWGPLNGYYYHIKDKHLAIDNDKNNKDHEIPFLFKYNAIDYENIVKDEPNDDVDNKDANNINDLPVKEYQQCRFEWVYHTTNDNVSYHKLNDASYKNSLLPDKYETIRQFLKNTDPIPPHFLRRARMADMVFQGAIKSTLRNVKELKCRIITKEMNNASIINIQHPALLIWRRSEKFDEHNERAFYIIHLRKLSPEYQSEEEKKENMEQIEIECRPILKHSLDRNKWDYYNYKEQNLDLKHGLVDIAHWCLKYEMEHDYKYDQYASNCRQFMMDLCNTFNIIYDATNWTDKVCYVAKKSDSMSGFFCYN